MEYSVDRINLAARSFRTLADTYNELVDKGCSNIEYKKAIMLQLNEMASILECYSGAGATNIEFDKDKKKSLVKLLKSRGVIVGEVILIKRNEKNEELIITASTVKGNCITVKELGYLISEILSVKYIPIENQRSIVTTAAREYYFQKAPRFKSICRIASICKGENQICGDTFSHIRLSKGQEILCIVDGMGSGVRANRDSKIVIELLEQLLEAGFSEMAAIRMINTAFSINDYVGNPITLDMCMIDMYLGVCNFIKLGAVATFIKRKGWVEVIKSTTLPIGVFETVDFDNTVKKLYDGDYVIMVSDGVLESFPGENKEEQLIEVIAYANFSNPKAMRDYILKCALDNTDGEATDDMTVAVILMAGQE